MRNRINILTSLFKLLIGPTSMVVGSSSMLAQEPNAVKVVARPKSDSILLRWAPTNKETWRLGNQYGYMVERIILVENKQRLSKPKREILTSAPIKPLPLNAWEPIAKNNKYGAIAAQALYGEEFKTDPKKGATSSWTQMYQKSTEQDMRFGFALFAADMDVNTSKASGLRFVDTKAKKGDKYLYKVYVQQPTPTLKVDTAMVFTGSDEYAPLPKPAEFSTVFLDSVAMLSWNTKVQENVYVAYEVERSTDNGVSFLSRTQEPFVPILKDNKNQFAFYKDSTLANVETQYRIRGLNAFGEKGPYSIITKGKSQPTPQQAPKYVTYEVVENKNIKLSWQYDAKQTSLIQGFKVLRSSEHEKGYQVISGATLIAKTQFNFLDAQPLGAGYYQIVAVDLKGQEHSSFPVMVQFEDSEPPKAPVGIKGSIDKTGKVSIAWTANTEKDLLGYYVYSSNARQDESSRLTPDPIKTATFAHQISLKTLTDSVYYEVLAMDKRYNESKRTLIALPRPDVIPPAPISLIETKGTDKGIQITWHNSPSKDAQKYVVTRKEGLLDLAGKVEVNENFAIIPHKGDTTVFSDTTAQFGKTYQYVITVVDKSGLKPKEPIYTVEIRRKPQTFSAKAVEITGNWHENGKKIVLNWKATGSPVKHWIIYRSSQGERLAQYEAAVGETFTDIQVEQVKTYQYILRPVYLDRTLGGMSEAINVKFEKNK